MRTILVNGCSPDRVFGLMDPDAPTEEELETSVQAALNCAYPSYRCEPFRGSFRYDDRVYQPDLALIARDLSHWFIIEVELTSHSFDGHVLPQVKAFRYGAPQPDCKTWLKGIMNVDAKQLDTFLTLVPRAVAVIANRRDPSWQPILRSHDIQYLTVSAFRSANKIEAIEIDGSLEVVSKSLGFGQYSAVDRSLKFPKGTRLPSGEIQLNEPSGSVATWSVTDGTDALWVTKKVGSPSLANDNFVQLIQTVDGRLSLRIP